MCSFHISYKLAVFCLFTHFLFCFFSVQFESDDSVPRKSTCYLSPLCFFSILSQHSSVFLPDLCSAKVRFPLSGRKSLPCTRCPVKHPITDAYRVPITADCPCSFWFYYYCCYISVYCLKSESDRN